MKEEKEEQNPVLQWLIIAFLAGANLGYALSQIIELLSK